jgi:type III pantothenate kinase
MNLVIDAGNTRTKIAIFEGDKMREKHVFDDASAARSLLSGIHASHLLVSAVTNAGFQLGEVPKVSGSRYVLTQALPLPIHNRYATPETLGADRLAAACGAWHQFPGKDSLVIDCGTCINYEFVNARGEYLGGAISPGLSMRFRSMHEGTDKLPLAAPVPIAVGAEAPSLTGGDTDTCLVSGVMNGMLEEIKGIMARYASHHPDVRVILTGGDAGFFEKPLKPSIFVAPELVLEGLNSILLHNVNS